MAGHRCRITGAAALRWRLRACHAGSMPAVHGNAGVLEADRRNPVAAAGSAQYTRDLIPVSAGIRAGRWHGFGNQARHAASGGRGSALATVWVVVALPPAG